MSGVVREIVEETGIKVVVSDLKLLYARTDPYELLGESVNRMLFVVKLHEEQAVRLSFEHDAYKWVDIKTAIQDFDHPFYNPGLHYALKHDLL